MGIASLRYFFTNHTSSYNKKNVKSMEDLRHGQENPAEDYAHVPNPIAIE